MIESDANAMLQVETAATEFPWSLAQFISSFQTGDEITVLEVNNIVRGFSVFQLILDESSLLNFAVHPQYQGQGYGRFLLEQGLASQIKAGACKCILEVRISNISAQKLYQSLGFVQIGERKNYYPGMHNREDALVMSRGLPQALLDTI